MFELVNIECSSSWCSWQGKDSGALALAIVVVSCCEQHCWTHNSCCRMTAGSTTVAIVKSQQY